MSRVEGILDSTHTVTDDGGVSPVREGETKDLVSRKGPKENTGTLTRSQRRPLRRKRVSPTPRGS